jgi:oxygen-dependent protoporphyrinogen oxidase
LPSPRVAVAGGGITGLSAAYELVRSGVEQVVLLEADDRLGGKIKTESLDGIRIECGPDSFVARDPHPKELCAELGLAGRLVEPARFGAHVWTGDRLRPIPPALLMGVPTELAALVRSRVLSPLGSLRALGDLVLPGPLRGPDVAIGSFVRRRFGPEVLARLVDPIVAGTRAGSPDELSLAAAAPQLDQLARAHRSVLAGSLLERRRGRMVAGSPPFLGLEGGMEQLVTELRAHLEPAIDLRLSARLQTVRSSGGRFRLRGAFGDLEADGVVLALPAFGAATALRDLNPGASEELQGVEYAAVAIVNLLYPSDAVSFPQWGSGILVPSTERRTLAGCTWVTRKWPGVTGERDTLIRAFIGRGRSDPALQLSDDALVFRAHDELAQAMDFASAPRAARLARWERAIPLYAVAHNRRVERVERMLEGTPRVALAGAGYRGSGITDCIAQGRSAARRVLEALTRKG